MQSSSTPLPPVIASTVAPIAATTTVATNGAAPSMDSWPANVMPCFDPAKEAETLVAAWPKGERAFYCFKKGESEEARTKSKVTCMSVDRMGERHIETVTASAPPRLPTLTLDKRAKDKVEFILTGGKREPHGATGTLKVNDALSKTAPIEYDEHFAIEGWIGNGLVYRTWVDEGPGCSRFLVNPKEIWPAVNGEAATLGGCYGTAPFTRANEKEIAADLLR
jgi:hypothetical protein